MEPYLLSLIIGTVALVLGLLIGNNTRKGKNKSLLEEAQRQAKDVLQKAKLDAEAIKNHKKLQAKEHFIELKSTHEREIHKREQKITEAENRAKQKESQLQKELNSNLDLKKK